MYDKLKKLFSVLLLISVVFAFVSPVSAAGIIKAGFSEIGEKTDFAGHNWTLYKKDANSGYIITSVGLGSTPFKAGTQYNNKYAVSDLRKKINELEAKMKSYTGEPLTWSEVSGTADGKNYIEKHDMTESGVSAYGVERNPGFSSMSSYNDLLYALSTDEANEVSGNIRNAVQDWWLRTPGKPYYNAAIVNYFGKGDVDGFGHGVNDDNCVARPALQINLNSPIFQTVFKTAPNGKAAVTVGSGFTLADYGGSKGWKLTLKNSRIATPEITSFAKTEEKIIVEYRNAATGENTYLSALLYDENGRLINYAKAADVSQSGSGRAEIPTCNLPAGNYKIRFFCEKINGNGKFDHVSELSGEYSITTIGIFQALSIMPRVNGTNSTTVLYNGDKWAKFSDTKLLRYEGFDSTESGGFAVNGKVRAYASTISDAIENKINGGCSLLSLQEAESLSHSARRFGEDWWLATTRWRTVRYYVNDEGGIGDTNVGIRDIRPVLNVKNMDSIFFLSAVKGGAKSGEAGVMQTSAEDAKEYKITYKDDTLSAPSDGTENDLCRFNAGGDSFFPCRDTDRIVALAGSDSASATGYAVVKKNENGISLNFDGYNAENRNIYLHKEIIGGRYDRLSAASLVLKNTKYENGNLTALTLDNTVKAGNILLMWGFNLSLEDKRSYKQNIMVSGDKNILTGLGGQGAKITGITTILPYNELVCKGRVTLTEINYNPDKGDLDEGGKITAAEGSILTLERPYFTLPLKTEISVETGGTVINYRDETLEVKEGGKTVQLPSGYSYTGGSETPVPAPHVDYDWDDGEEETKPSSSGGCNAGFGALALLALAGLVYKRNRK
ncbi:MAG: Synerg-CTERM sorting domain-containing protein [Synergistaceae bacterium]|nr:Synerg-CTERM sorting domain-containing protein [Synergistaceae bacterium]